MNMWLNLSNHDCKITCDEEIYIENPNLACLLKSILSLYNKCKIIWDEEIYLKLVRLLKSILTLAWILTTGLLLNADFAKRSNRKRKSSLIQLLMTFTRHHSLMLCSALSNISQSPMRNIGVPLALRVTLISGCFALMWLFSLSKRLKPPAPFLGQLSAGQSYSFGPS